MVSSLVSDNRIALGTDGTARTVPMPVAEEYHHQQFCQIWSFSGTLVGRSSGAPAGRLVPEATTGFRDMVKNGERLRVYSIVNQDLGVQVMVGDNLAVRDRLVRDVIEGFLLPAVVILPVMAVLIWFATAQGLAPLDRLANQLAGRKVTDLGELPLGPNPPREIRPVIGALNDLFGRLAIARTRERDFISYAAHELKTPLAGLKMQAQLARRVEDPAARDHALEAIETSVTRTDRMVRQLLDLARVDQRSQAPGPVDPGAVARQIMAELTDLADRRGVRLDIQANGQAIPAKADAFLLAVALRNLIENAIQATPKGGRVTLAVTPDANGIALDLHDGGSGLPPDLLGRATEKFVKGAQSDSSGSGLGLAIASDALDALGATLRFEMRNDGHHTQVFLPA